MNNYVESFDFNSTETSAAELKTSIDAMTAEIMNQTGCSVGHAKNILCNLDKITNNMEHEDITTFSPKQLIAFGMAGFHHRTAIQHYLTNRNELANAHWNYYKTILTEFFSEHDNNNRSSVIKEIMAMYSTKGTNARHAENRDMKKQALEWYAANKHSYPSKDDAAQELTKIVPVKFRTARDWLINQ